MNTEIASVKSTRINHENKALFFHDAFFQKFKSTTQFYSLFHVIFWSVGFLQLLAILMFFSFFSKTTWSALALASLFLTGFSYLVLHFYFQTKKPQQFLEMKEEVDSFFSDDLSNISSSTEKLLNRSEAYIALADSLHEKEALYYQLPKSLITLSVMMEKFSIWLHWKDILKMKELFLLSSINNIIATIKLTPLDLHAHARLATGYLLLSQIYLDPRKAQKTCSLRWISPEYNTNTMLSSFHSASDRAIEELTIISEYAPSDVWTHLQLAKVYHDKNRHDLEIKAYETLNELKPDDEEILLRLGSLYFHEGYNAKAMKIYEKLRQISEPLSEELISHYDSFQFHDLSMQP